MIQKLLAMTSIMVMIFNSFTCFSQTSYYNLNVNEADIVCIDFKISSGQGRPQTVTEAYLMKNFNFQTTDKIYIAYITHYLNSLELINDGIISGGADGDYAYMYLTHKDGGKENFLFAFDRFIDDDNKQYAIDKTMYIRLIDFIYALKAEKIIIDNISELPSQWCEGEIEKAVNDGLVPKWNQINYTGEISRLEVCQLIDNYLKLCAVEAEEAPKTPFSDTKTRASPPLAPWELSTEKPKRNFAPMILPQEKSWQKFYITHIA